MLADETLIPALRQRLRLAGEELRRALADRHLAAGERAARRRGGEARVVQCNSLGGGVRIDALPTASDAAAARDRICAARTFEIGTEGRPRGRRDASVAISVAS